VITQETEIPRDDEKLKLNVSSKSPDVSLKKPQQKPPGTSKDVTQKELNQKEVSQKQDPSKKVLLSSLNPSFKILDGSTSERDKVLEFNDLCIDDSGLFFIKSDKISDVPNINLGASAAEMDVHMRIFGRDKGEIDPKVTYIDYPLFTLGGVWPYHLTHFFINNFTPLVNIINRVYGDYDWYDKPRDLYIHDQGTTYFDIGSLGFKQIHRTKSDETICYKKAIIGVGNTCDCCGCTHDLPDKHVYKVE
jgi:hypothetical protein